MKKPKKNSKRITKGLLAYHIAASLVSTAPHPHTGRSIHHRHTSHGILFLALILTGIVLFSNLGVLRAYGLASSGTRTITATINGAPPTVGADITFPTTETKTKSPQIQVAGTCAPSLLVAIYNNGSFAGSTICSNTSDYTVTIQLSVGANVLQAQNYDGLNQPGPTTPQVLISLEQDPVPVGPTAPTTPSGSSDPNVPLVATTPADIQTDPAPPSIATPVAKPSENPCYDPVKSDAVSQKIPKIVANCISRSIDAGDTVTLPVRVSGDHPPFALQIDWGDGVSELKSVLDTQFHDYKHQYLNTGIIDVALKTTDSKGASSFLQTVVQVNGDPTAAGPAGSFGNITSGLESLWTEAPVPLYWAAVTLVVGFWIGDIFQRIFARGRYAIKGRRGHGTINRQRHA